MFTVAGVSATNNLKTPSSILKGEIAFMKQLQKWLGEKCKWNLCYRASRDGWSAQDFHKHCNNKGPTVVLVKANNCIFGGYTDQGWEGMSEKIYILIFPLFMRAIYFPANWFNRIFKTMLAQSRTNSEPYANSFNSICLHRIS